MEKYRLANQKVAKRERTGLQGKISVPAVAEDIPKKANKRSKLRRWLIAGALTAGILGVGAIAAYQYNTPREYVINVPGYGLVREKIQYDQKTFTNFKSGVPITPADGRLYKNVKDNFDESQID